MYGQYIFNNTVISPAQAGVNDHNQFGALTRYQWLGMDGAPVTHSAFFNLRLPARLGMALGVYQDNIGPVTDLTVQTDLAFHTRLSRNWSIAAGIRLSASELRINFLDLDHVDHNDPNFNENIRTGLQLNVGAGLLFFSQNAFFGVAVPKAHKNGFGDTPPGGYSVARHFFGYGGANFTLSQGVSFSPSFLVKYPESAPVQLDFNAVFGLGEWFDFGPVIRSNLDDGWVDAVGFLAGLHLGERWYFGYMFEYPANAMNLATRQSHEISLRYKWGMPRDIRIRSPRYFL